MALHRVAPIALLALAACSPRQTELAPRPLVPKNGPEAHVRVEYDGGTLNRRLEALFTVKRPAYVMVAHLGGDGVVRVLFPEDPRESGWIRGGRVYRTDAASADYDAAPGYWFMRPTFHRSVAARQDSYDGNGHGYVFMIASETPLRFDRVSDVSLWNEYELPGYATALDPRGLIRAYADMVSAAGGYTLDYATSTSSYAHYSYAGQRAECAMLSAQRALMPYYWNAIGYSGFHSLSWSCNGASYFDWNYHDYLRRRQIAMSTGLPGIPIPVTPTNPTPVATPMPINPRSGRRDPLGPGRSASSSSSPRPIGGRTVDEGRSRDRGEEIHPAPRTPRRDAHDGTGFGTPRHSEPRRDADTPRASSPRASEPASSSSSGASAASPSPRASSGGDSRPGAGEMKRRDP